MDKYTSLDVLLFLPLHTFHIKQRRTTFHPNSTPEGLRAPSLTQKHSYHLITTLEIHPQSAIHTKYTIYVGIFTLHTGFQRNLRMQHLSKPHKTIGN